MQDNTDEPSLEEIAEASTKANGRFPKVVIDAFLPKKKSAIGRNLVPITAGHELLLSQLDHPLSNGKAWEDQDVLMAFFVFSRPSRESFALVADGKLESEFYQFIDTIPASDLVRLGEDMVSHWMQSRKTAIEMVNDHSTAQKKTVVLDGGSQQFPRIAKSIMRSLRMLFMIFRFAKSSR